MIVELALLAGALISLCFTIWVIWNILELRAKVRAIIEILKLEQKIKNRELRLLYEMKETNKEGHNND